MKQVKQDEMLTMLIACFLGEGGDYVNDLQDAIQDMGYTDRQIVDMTKAAVIIAKEWVNKNEW